MTAYTFAAHSSAFSVNWSDPASWSGGVAPNAADADVTIPVITTTATGQPVEYQIVIQNGQSFSVNSVTQNSDYLDLIGSLSVKGAYQLNGEIDLGGGPLSVGSLQTASSSYLQGSGTVVDAGTLINQGFLGLTGSVTAATFQNSGTLYAGTGAFTLTTTQAGGGFSNLVGGVLTSGTYEAANGGALNLNVGGTITTDAANIILGTGTFTTVDPTTGNAVPLQSTLTTVATGGVLTLQGSYVTSNALTIQGTLAMSGSASLSASALTIASGGVLSYTGSIASSDITAAGGAIVDNGVISASPVQNGNGLYSSGSVYIGEAVTGSGSIVIGSGVQYFLSPLQSVPSTALATVELAGAVSTHVVFSNALDALLLDAPQTFTGTIDGYVYGDTVSLNRIALSSITGESYAGTATGGVLTLNEGASTISLAFSGNHTIADFALSAGAQALSSTPPSVVISETVTLLSAAQAVSSFQAGTLQGLAQVQDTATDVVANLDALQSLAAAGKLASIAVIGAEPPAYLSISVAQLNQDAAALNSIVNDHALIVAGAPGVLNTADFAGAHTGYTVSTSGGSISVGQVVTGEEMVDSLNNVQQVKFSDGTLVFDLHSSQDLLVYELYQAAYGRTPDNGGFRYWAGIADANATSALHLADAFLAAPEFTQVYGVNPSNTTFITELYQHVLDRAPDQAGLAYWVGQANGGQPRDQLLVDFAVSAENVQLIGAHVATGYWTT